MCAMCGSIGKYGQGQNEAIERDRERLKRIQDARAKKAESK